MAFWLCERQVQKPYLQSTISSIGSLSTWSPNFWRRRGCLKHTERERSVCVFGARQSRKPFVPLSVRSKQLDDYAESPSSLVLTIADNRRRHSRQQTQCSCRTACTGSVSGSYFRFPCGLFLRRPHTHGDSGTK